MSCFGIQERTSYSSSILAMARFTNVAAFANIQSDYCGSSVASASFCAALHC